MINVENKGNKRSHQPSSANNKRIARRVDWVEAFLLELWHVVISQLDKPSKVNLACCSYQMAYIVQQTYSSERYKLFLCKKSVRIDDLIDKPLPPPLSNLRLPPFTRITHIEVPCMPDDQMLAAVYDLTQHRMCTDRALELSLANSDITARATPFEHSDGRKLIVVDRLRLIGELCSFRNIRNVIDTSRVTCLTLDDVFQVGKPPFFVFQNLCNLTIINTVNNEFESLHSTVSLVPDTCVLHLSNLLHTYAHLSDEFPVHRVRYGARTARLPIFFNSNKRKLTFARVYIHDSFTLNCFALAFARSLNRNRGNVPPVYYTGTAMALLTQAFATDDTSSVDLYRLLPLYIVKKQRQENALLSSFEQYITPLMKVFEVKIIEE